MQKIINEIVNDLIQLDPEFASMEQDLHKLVKKLLAAKPPPPLLDAMPKSSDASRAREPNACASTCSIFVSNAALSSISSTASFATCMVNRSEPSNCCHVKKTKTASVAPAKVYASFCMLNSLIDKKLCNPPKPLDDRSLGEGCWRRRVKMLKNDV